MKWNNYFYFYLFFICVYWHISEYSNVLHYIFACVLNKKLRLNKSSNFVKGVGITT